MIRPHATRNQRLREGFGFVSLLGGVAVAASFGGGVAALLAGDGWRPALAYPTYSGLLATLRADEGATPLGLHTVPSPAPVWLWVVCGTVLFAGWARLLVVPLMRPPADPRTKALGQWRKLRGILSASAARKAGRFTRPDLTARQRRLWGARVPLTELGYQVGRMRDGGHELWANFELRVRVIARTGWGKTARLLVKIARELPGAALIGSTGADLFEQTVLARQRGRRLPRRYWPIAGTWWDPRTWWPHPDWAPWTRDWWRTHYGPDRPVWVVDFSSRDHRYAAGWPRVHWNPLEGCQDWELALRRGRALVAGAEDGNRGDEQDGFFRDSAGQVIAAWWHAAALAGLPMAEVVRWQQNIDLPDAKNILLRHPAATKAAHLALEKHLDRRADRTTSSVERFVLLAMAPFATGDGEDFVSGRTVKVADLITGQATVYLLASDTTAAAVAPILSLFADEWVHTARAVAISLPTLRLPVPAVAVLDELRLLTPIPSLPQVAYEMRKYGIGLVYALQNAAQEDELYHQQAKSLRQNVQLTIVGGFDEDLVDQLRDQAGEAPVPSPSVSGGLLEVADLSESTTWRHAMTPADLQDLVDGEAAMRVAGVRPFYVRFESFRDDRRLRRQITGEERAVRAGVVAAQATDAAARETAFLVAQRTYERPRIGA